MISCIAVCPKRVPDPTPVEVSPLTAIFDFPRECGLLAEDTPTDGEAPDAVRG